MNVVLFCLVALLASFVMLLWDVYRIPQRVRDRFAQNLAVSTALVIGTALVTVLMLSAQISHMEANCHARNDGHPSHSSP